MDDPINARHRFHLRPRRRSRPFRAWVVLGWGGGAILLGLLLALPAWGQITAGSMASVALPKGGRTLLLQVLGSPPDRALLRTIATGKRDAKAWRRMLSKRTRRMKKAERATLAAYLAVNMPLSSSALAQAMKGKEPGKAFPRDGKELAAGTCINGGCHSEILFRIYKRNAREWLKSTSARHHALLKYNDRQARTFAGYAARNLPVK